MSLLLNGIRIVDMKDIIIIFIFIIGWVAGLLCGLQVNTKEVNRERELRQIYQDSLYRMDIYKTIINLKTEVKDER